MGKDAAEGLSVLSKEHPDGWRVLSRERIVSGGRSRAGFTTEGWAGNLASVLFFPECLDIQFNIMLFLQPKLLQVVKERL
jgi:hypothetical protein